MQKKIDKGKILGTVMKIGWSSFFSVEYSFGKSPWRGPMKFFRVKFNQSSLIESNFLICYIIILTLKNFKNNFLKTASRSSQTYVQFTWIHKKFINNFSTNWQFLPNYTLNITAKYNCRPLSSNLKFTHDRT